MVAKSPFAWAYCTPSYTGNPAAAPGVTVTPGFSNADGTAVAVLGTALTHDVELMEIKIGAAVSNFANNIDTSSYIDILIDRAGGTSWDTTNRFIEGLQSGYMVASGSGGLGYRKWLFPVWLPAGTTVAAIGRSIVASGAVAVEVSIDFYGGPSRPSQWWCGQKVDAIGLNAAASQGTIITPSASANTYGSWTSVGSATARKYGCLIPSLQPNGVTNTGTVRQLEIGISSIRVGPTFNYNSNNNEWYTDLLENKLIFRTIPEATQLQARTRNGSASGTPDSVIIHGVA